MNRFLDRDDLAVIGDAAITSGAVNALFMSVVMLATEVVFSSTRVPSWIELLSAILFFGGAVVGPIVAWLLAGRRVTVPAAVGGILGVGVAAAAFVVLGGLVWLLRRLIGSRIPDFPLELVIIASLVGLVLVVVAVALVRDALADRRLPRPLHPMRDAVRIASVAVMVTYVVGIAVLAVQPGAGEIAEAPMFMLTVALGGAGVVTGAALAERVLARGSSEESVTPL